MKVQGSIGETKVFLGITILCLLVGFTVILFLHKRLIKLSHALIIILAPVAQLDRAFDFGSKG